MAIKRKAREAPEHGSYLPREILQMRAFMILRSRGTSRIPSSIQKKTFTSLRRCETSRYKQKQAQIKPI